MSPELAGDLQKAAALLASHGIMIPAAAAPAALPPGFAPPAPVAPAGGSSWLTPPAPQGAMPQPAGWSIVMEIEVQGPKGAGKATVDLCYGPETWSQAPQIVQALIQQGFPVKVWVPKQNTGWGGGQRRTGWGG